MAAQLQEITGKYLRTRFRFENDSGDVVIAEINCPKEGRNVSAKGPADPEQLTAGLHYRFFGKWTQYKGEQQFSFNSFVALAPVDRESIITYLSIHGAGHGLGKVRAAKLCDEFGQEAVRVARTQPEKVAEYLTSVGYRYKVDAANGLASTLAKGEAKEQIKLDLVTLLSGRGFPKSIVDTIIQEWGNRGAMIVRRNPYRLMKFAGCGFKRCDAMYLDLGLPAGRLKRQALCAWYSLAQNTDGHTWFSWKVIDAYLRTNIGAAKVQVERAIELAVRARLIMEVRTVGVDGALSASGDARWFAEWEKAVSELQICERVCR